MNIRNKQKLPQKYTKRIIIAACALLVVASCIAIAYNMSRSNNPSSSVNDGTSSNAQESSAKTSPAEQSPGLPDDSEASTTDDIPTSSTLSVVIDSFSQSNGAVDVTASSSSDGTCVFSAEPADGGKPVTRQVEAASGSCSISIPETEFTYLGNWKLTVILYSNDEKSEATKDVSIT